jgi:hypothetical protein
MCDIRISFDTKEESSSKFIVVAEVVKRYDKMKHPVTHTAGASKKALTLSIPHLQFDRKITLDTQANRRQ